MLDSDLISDMLIFEFLIDLFLSQTFLTCLPISEIYISIRFRLLIIQSLEEALQLPFQRPNYIQQLEKDVVAVESHCIAKQKKNMASDIFIKSKHSRTKYDNKYFFQFLKNRNLSRKNSFGPINVPIFTTHVLICY